jgi:hypothetical protein
MLELGDELKVRRKKRRKERGQKSVASISWFQRCVMGRGNVRSTLPRYQVLVVDLRAELIDLHAAFYLSIWLQSLMQLLLQGPRGVCVRGSRNDRWELMNRKNEGEHRDNPSAQLPRGSSSSSYEDGTCIEANS